MHIIVVRHYKTEKNVSNKIIGWGNSPPAKGWRKDIDYIEQVFRQKKFQFAAIYSSALERAKMTSLHYEKAMGYQKGIFQHTHDLNEIDYGDCSNKDKSWVENNIPQHKTDPNFVYPGGESFRQMQRRSVDFVKRTAQGHEDQTVLVVVHAGVIRGLVCHFLQLPYQHYLKTRTSHSYIGDFEFEAGVFTRYREHGKPSGFVASLK